MKQKLTGPAPRRQLTMQIHEDPDQGMPEGRLEYQVAVLPTSIRIEAAYLSFLDRRDESVKTIELDEDLLVDLDIDDNVSGIEFLAFKKRRSEVQKFLDFISLRTDSERLSIAASTVMSQWERLQSQFDEFFKLLQNTAATQPQEMTSAVTGWKTPEEGELLAASK